MFYTLIKHRFLTNQSARSGPIYILIPDSNSLTLCYITKFLQRMLYYKIPSAYVILPNSSNVCYITKFPQRMLYYQIPCSVCYIAKFLQRML